MLAQDLARVLARQRRMAPQRARRVRELYRDAGHRDAAFDRRVVHPHEHLAVQHLRIFEDLHQILHRARGDAALPEALDPFRGRALEQAHLQRGDERVAVRDAVDVRRVARIAAHLGEPELLHERRELAVGAVRDVDERVLRAEQLVRHDRRMGVAVLLRLDAADQVVGGDVREQAHDRLEQAGVDALSLAGALARGEREQDAVHRVEAAADVGDRDPDARRPAPRLAGDAHDPAHGLAEHVVPR